ncbi:hypothetical protein FALBO_3129 [Fusarium albosuccineum]|uniref:Uncharacterized protein n=1 Tax=Fusarium albosuccineum TaxID=1237068 RepID=A0A8H4PEX6_9HYPO|nr:hypothetical protein FALBO_3129 [Fusarium albosuccineum]
MESSRYSWRNIAAAAHEGTACRDKERQTSAKARFQVSFVEALAGIGAEDGDSDDAAEVSILLAANPSKRREKLSANARSARRQNALSAQDMQAPSPTLVTGLIMASSRGMDCLPSTLPAPGLPARWLMHAWTADPGTLDNRPWGHGASDP